MERAERGRKRSGPASVHLPRSICAFSRFDGMAYFACAQEGVKGRACACAREWQRVRAACRLVCERRVG
eukprot:1398074-Pleurochrysis_carterae.AAC.1